MTEVPVYLFTGFLESGKTQFIQETLEDKRFNQGQNILLLVCEEGIEEYDEEKFSGNHVFIEEFEDSDAITDEYLTSLEKRYKPDVVVIEYNGMWLLQELYDALPQNWLVYQEMMFCEAKTFLPYNKNMRQLMVDKLTSCEMLVLNRADEAKDLDREEVHKIIRGSNRKCTIAYENTDGTVEYDEIEDPLPFDINASVVKINDEDYALFYRDLVEETAKYNGKVIEFKGVLARDDEMSKKEAVVGRRIMTCCDYDISYYPIACSSKTELNFKSGDWVTLRAKLKIKRHPVYEGEGPVLMIEKIIRAIPPEEEVAAFF